MIAVSVLAIAAATGGWMYYRYESTPKNLELYGNVDIRQVNLAFLWPERIKSILTKKATSLRRENRLPNRKPTRLRLKLNRLKQPNKLLIRPI